MRTEEIEGRIQNLEIGMQTVMLRLQAMETKLGSADKTVDESPIQTGPPPILTFPPVESRPQQVLHPEPPKVSVKIPDYIQKEPVQTETTSQQPAYTDFSQPPRQPNQDSYSGYDNSSQYGSKPTVASADEMEYKFGINGLLRGGAVVIVCAVLFLVALALGRGWITPTMQFGGEILLCLGFISIGIWKHEEREDFGQLMVGIGSFGLYASFAGAYAFKHLYEGETLVVLYMLLSLANLGFSHWRASKSFLTIGMIGGLVAAIMPMQKDKVLLDFALHFLILVPCALIIIKNKWNGMAALMWAVSSAALWPATTSHFEQAYRVGATYLNCAIALYACGKVFKPSDFDKHAAIQSAMLVLTGFFAIGIDVGHKGSLHALALTAIAIGIGYAIKENEKARNSTWLGGLIVFAIMTPLGFVQNVATYWYAVESLILIVLALRYQYAALAAVGLATFLFSLVAYLFSPNKETLILANFSPPLETLLLAIFTTTVVLNIRYAMQQKTKELGELALFFGASLIVAFFIRGLNVFLGNGNTPLSTEDISSIGLGAASLALLAMATRLKRVGLFVISSLLGLVSCGVALLHEPTANPIWISPSLLLMATGVVILASRYILASEDESYHEPTLVLAGIILSSFFMRILGLAGANQLLGLNTETVNTFGVIVLNVAWTGFLVGYRRPAYRILGWLSFVAAMIGALSLSINHGPAWLSPFALIVPMVSVAVLYWATPRNDAEEQALAALVVIAEWILISFLAVRHFTTWLDIKQVAALTLSWVTLATVLIVFGFKGERRHLRYWSLGIFMVTVGKVFLIDLAELDSFVRVLMLALLGLGMMGGGYWYILWRRSHSLPKPNDTV